MNYGKLKHQLASCAANDSIEIKVALTELIFDSATNTYRKKKRFLKIDRVVPSSKGTVTIHLL